MCSSLDGSHSRAIVRIAAIVGHGICSRPPTISSSHSRSNSSARHSVQPSHTSPKLRERSTRTRSRRTSTLVDAGERSSNSSYCSARPLIWRASACARARPCASSSPSYATVSCRTLPPRRTERTRRQYVCVLPSLRTVECRRYTRCRSPTSGSHARTGTNKGVGWHYTRLSAVRACDVANLRRGDAPKKDDRVANCGSWASAPEPERAVPRGALPRVTCTGARAPGQGTRQR